jgi:hypothetical protein
MHVVMTSLEVVRRIVFKFKVARTSCGFGDLTNHIRYV